MKAKRGQKPTRFLFRGRTRLGFTMSKTGRKKLTEIVQGDFVRPSKRRKRR